MPHVVAANKKLRSRQSGREGSKDARPVTSRRPPRYEQYEEARPRTRAHCAVCLLIPGGYRAKSVWPATDGVPAPAHAVAGNRSVRWSLRVELPHLSIGRRDG